MRISDWSSDVCSSDLRINAKRLLAMITPNNMNIRTHYGYVWVFLGLLLFVSACAKDDGYYKPTGIDKHFDGDTYAYLKSKPGVYDSLIQVIDRLELQSTMRDSHITLFADQQSVV